MHMYKCDVTFPWAADERSSKVISTSSKDSNVLSVFTMNGVKHTLRK